MKISVEASENALQAIADVIVEGVNDPRVRLSLYQGTPPATINDLADPADLIGSINMVINDEYDIINSMVDSSLMLNADVPTQVTQTGIVSYFRLYNKDDVAVFEGTVTDTLGNGDMKLATVNFYLGQYIHGENLRLFIKTQP